MKFHTSHSVAPALLAFLLALCPSRSQASPLQQAEVHKIVNEVRIVEAQRGATRPAKLNDVIKDDVAVRTGVQSRAELLFQDNTLTRLGAEALFSFKSGTRDLTLDRGTMLLQVPKGLGGATIRTAAVTAAITGTTIMIENIPGSHVKVLVLEGSLRLSINGRLGESTVLTPGKMVIVSVKDKQMPKPVAVDLAKLVKTSALIDPEKFRGNANIKVDALPSIGLIEKEIAVQTGSKQNLQLAETNLVIQGDGTKVVIASKDFMASLDAGTKNGSGDPVLLTTDSRSISVALPKTEEPPLPSGSNSVSPTNAGSKSNSDSATLPSGTTPDSSGGTGGTTTSTGGTTTSTGGTTTGTGGTTSGTGGTTTGTGGTTTGTGGTTTSTGGTTTSTGGTTTSTGGTTTGTGGTTSGTGGTTTGTGGTTTGTGGTTTGTGGTTTGTGGTTTGTGGTTTGTGGTTTGTGGTTTGTGGTTTGTGGTTTGTGGTTTGTGGTTTGTGGTTTGTGGTTTGTGGTTTGTGGTTTGTGGTTTGTGGTTTGTGGTTTGTGGTTTGTGGTTTGTGGTTTGTGGTTTGTGGTTTGTGGTTTGTGGTTTGTGGTTTGTGGTTTGTGGTTGEVADPITITDAALPTPIVNPANNTTAVIGAVPIAIPGSTPYIIKATTVIDTTQTSPSITTDGITNTSLFFKNTATNGSASKFLFGSSSTFDGQMNFDPTFNQQFPNTAVYKFNDLEIDGNPTFLTKGGQSSVAWISNTNVNTSSLPGVVVLDGVKDLFIGTVNGSINLTNQLAFKKIDGTAFSVLQFYARNGDVNFGAPVTIDNAKLYIYAQNNVNLAATANLATSVASVIGMGNVTSNANITADFAQLYAGSVLTTAGTYDGKFFYGFGNTGALGGSFIADNTTMQFTSTVDVAATANFDTNKLTLTSNSGNINFAGSATGTTLAFNVATDFTSLAGSTITALGGPGTVAITSAGGMTLGGQTNAKSVTLTASTTTAVGAINLNGPIQADSLNANGYTVAINGNLTGKDLTVTGKNGVTTGAASIISATGNTTFSSTKSTVLNGAGAFNNLQFDQAGNVAINGTTTAQMINTVQNHSIGSFTVGGNLTTAKDIHLTQSGDFIVTNTGTVSANGNLMLSTASGINLGGATSANTMNLTATQDLTTSAAVSATGGFTSSSQNAVIGGTLTADQVNFTTVRNFSLATGVSIQPNKDLHLTSTSGDLTIDGTTNSQNFVASATKGTLTIDGTVQAANAQFSNGPNLTSNATVNGTVNAGSIDGDVKNVFLLNAGGALNSTGNVGINTAKLTIDGAVIGNNVTLAGTQTLTVNGAVQSQQFTATGASGIFNSAITSTAHDLKINLTSGFTQGAAGSLVSAGKVQITDGGSASISGTMRGTDLTLNSTGGFDLNSGADLRGTNSITITGSNTTIVGRVDAPTVSVTGSTALALDTTGAFLSADHLSLSTPGLLNLVAANGLLGGLDATRLQTLTASAKGITVLSDFLLSPGASNLTVGATGVTATGFSLGGFQNISINGGSYTGQDLSAATVNITNNGSLTLLGNLDSSSKVNVSKIISVAGTIGGGADLTAGTSLTAGAVSGAHNVTAPIVTVTGDLAASGNVNAAKTVDVGGVLSAGSVSASTSLSAGTLSAANVTTPILTIGLGGITTPTGGKSTINAPTIKTAFGIFMNGAAGSATAVPGSGGSLDLTTGSLTVDALGLLGGDVTSANFDGGDAHPSRNDAGGDGGTFKLTSSGNFTVNSPLSADTGKNSQPGMTGGNGGTVDVTTAGTITVNSRVKVSSTETSSNTADNTPGRASRNGGNIKLTSQKTTGTAIAINNSGELLSLLNAAGPGQGGKIEFASAGGAITVTGGRIQADKGSVNIANNGLAGTVTLTNATIRGDVVKVGALGANGQLLIGGGTINADTTLKLYGGSTGLVRFTDDVTLGGNSVKIIAGKTVTIDNAKTVTIGGSTAATVYADTANYTDSGGNGKTTGTFGGAGATTQKYTGPLPNGTTGVVAPKY